ncbi:Thyroid hormone receptor beta isoform X3 [Aphelenchoides fujianensis]|nr:Thyroid hormone receptor beta isoform X3 [Aphelenchoides fujianensis]
MNSLNICHVCSSDGAGRHFGGVCCERCMKFMRRTVRLNIRFECAGSGECAVTPNGRTTCKACRFAACLRAGMDPRLVHSDRLLDGDYSRGRKSKAASPPPDPSAPSGAIWEIIGRTDGPLGFRRPPLASCPDFETLLRFFDDVDRFVDAFEDPSSSLCPRWSLNVALGEVFLQTPSKLASRTKVSGHSSRPLIAVQVVWSAARKLSTDMILPVWSRNIVHYVDTASHIPEIRLLEPRDQLRLMAGRSMPSMWLLLLQRSLRYTTKRGILSTSGVYFPVDASDEEEGWG